MKSGFPRQMKMTHKYCEPLALSYIAGSLNVVYGSWGTNCLFDPNLLVGGHQPYYFDQMIALYNHYTVLSSRIVVELCATTDVTYAAGIYVDDDSSPARGELTTVMENSTCNSMVKRGNNEPVVLKKRWDAKAAFGGDIMDNDNLQGDVAANPVEQQVFIVWIGSPAVGPNVSVTGMVTIYYDVVWDELKVPIGS